MLPPSSTGYTTAVVSRKLLLRALTFNGKNIFSASYIKANRLPATSTVQRAVKELIKDGIIGKTNNEYFIADRI